MKKIHKEFKQNFLPNAFSGGCNSSRQAASAVGRIPFWKKNPPKPRFESSIIKFVQCQPKSEKEHIGNEIKRIALSTCSAFFVVMGTSLSRLLN